MEEAVVAGGASGDGKGSFGFVSGSPSLNGFDVLLFAGYICIR